MSEIKIGIYYHPKTLEMLEVPSPAIFGLYAVYDSTFTYYKTGQGWGHTIVSQLDFKKLYGKYKYLGKV